MTARILKGGREFNQPDHGGGADLETIGRAAVPSGGGVPSGG